jgi:hypothetical protein
MTTTATRLRPHQSKMLDAIMHSAADSPYAIWRAELGTYFEQPEEFDLAQAIYAFVAHFFDGDTPSQAYVAFDAWARRDV